MKDAITQFLKEYGDGVSFAELSKIKGFKGDFNFGYPEKNIYLWFNCSQSAVDTLTELRDESMVEFRPCNSLVYHADGLIPKVPIAKQIRNYSKKHWLPATLYKGQCFQQD